MLNGDLTTTVGGDRTVEMYDVVNVIGPGVITANHVAIDASGNVRNPTGVNYLLNGLQITTVGTAPRVEFTARGPAVQAINLAITGDAVVSSGQSVIAQNPCYSGLCIVPSGGYIPQSNAGSSLIVQASGDLTVVASAFGSDFLGGGFGGLSATSGFLFPGAVVLVAGGALNVNTVVDNAFTGTAAPFQGSSSRDDDQRAAADLHERQLVRELQRAAERWGGSVDDVQREGGDELPGLPEPDGGDQSAEFVPELVHGDGERRWRTGSRWLPLVNTTPFTQ